MLWIRRSDADQSQATSQRNLSSMSSTRKLAETTWNECRNFRPLRGGRIASLSDPWTTRHLLFWMSKERQGKLEITNESYLYELHRHTTTIPSDNTMQLLKPSGHAAMSVQGCRSRLGATYRFRPCKLFPYESLCSPTKAHPLYAQRNVIG